MGVWNERRYNTSWIVQLRRALDAAGLGGVQLVGTDLGWDVCTDMQRSAELRAAVAVVGVHYPVRGAVAELRGSVPDACTELGVPLWTSEGWALQFTNDWAGGMQLARTLSQDWREAGMTAMIVWTLAYAWYPILPSAGQDFAPDRYCACQIIETVKRIAAV